MNGINDILNGQVPQKTRFCWKCGEKAVKGEENCPHCGALYDGVNRFAGTNPLGMGGSGWSDAFGDVSTKRNDRTGKIVTLIFMLIVIAAIFIAMLASGDIEPDGEGIKIFGLIAGGMIVFWALWALFSSGGRMKKDWEGTVERKYERTKRHPDGRIDTEFVLDVRLDGGKKKKAVIKDDSMFYDYIAAGDRIRWHGRGRDYYEKYDKSKDYVIPCILCRVMHDVRENYCPVCGTKLPKGAVDESLLSSMEAKAPAPAGVVFIRAGQNQTRQPGPSAEKERYCVKCKEKLSPGSKFCENCGTKAEN